MRVIFSILVLLCGAAAPLQAQEGGGFLVRQYNTENGLPSNGIKGLEFDEATGFLWIASEAGVTRFNGINFEEMAAAQPATGGPQRMVMMVRNNNGALLTADEGGNVFQVQQNLLRLWRSAAEVRGKTNKLFYLVVNTPFYLAMDARDNRFALERHKIIPAGDSACWVVDNNVLHYVRPSGISPVPVAGGGTRRLFKIGAACFMAVESGGVYLLGANGNSISPVPVTGADGRPVSLIGAQRAVFWQNGMPNAVFIAGNGAGLLQYEGGRITVKPLFSNMPAIPLVRFVQYSEKQQTLFIGTDSRGLMILSANSTAAVRRATPDIKERNAYYAQIKLPGNRVLTNEGHVLGGGGAVAAPVAGAFEVWTFREGDSVLWYFQNSRPHNKNCLHRYHFATRSTRVYPAIANNDIGSMTASEGRIYIANKKGIGVLEQDSLRYLHQYPSVQGPNVTYSIAAIAPGVLAVANCRGLLRLSTTTGALDTIVSAGGICFRSIWQHRGYVFIGTYGGGFYLWKDGRIKAMPLDKHRYLLYAHCFMPDRNGYCWISTNRGLFQARIDDMIAAFEKDLPQVYYHYYGKNDGMDITEMNGGCTPCALELDNGTLSFPTMDGLLWVRPDNTPAVLPAGSIFIDGIMVDGRPVEPGAFSAAALPAKTGEIIVKPGFSGWCHEENVYLDYRLNAEGPWIPVDVQTSPVIKLSNLPPGAYVLQLRKLNGFGENNYAYKELAFRITTPWYRQWWFFVLCALLLLGFIALFFRLRTRQYKIRQRRLEAQVREKTRELQEKNEALEKNNTIKTRLISIISHDIVTPLKFLAVGGKNLLENRRKMSEDLQDETIREMTNTSQELQQLSTNILNWIKYQNENRRLVKEPFDVQELVNQVLGVLRSLAHQKGLRLDNQVAPGTAAVQYFEALKILVYNLVSNAINFSETGTITISGRLYNGKLLVAVADEGAGMSAAQIENVMASDVIVSSANKDNRKGNGLGYLIIKDLLKMMGGSLRIHSADGKGTTVEVEVPAG